MTVQSATQLPPGAYPAKCRTCGAAIFWALTPRGHDCPFDAEPVDGGKYVAGNFLRKVHMLDAPADTTENRYNSHFASCPNAGSHSRKSAH